MDIATKICTKCGQAKDVSRFGARKTARDGLKPHCRDCEAAYQRNHYAANQSIFRERKKLHMRQMRQDPIIRERWNAVRRANPEYRARERVYRRQVRHKHFFVWRARNWNSRHGTAIAPRELWALWRRQRGRCPLSGRKLDETAHLDHIIHVKNGIHTIDNLRWIDPRVNVARSNMTDDEFIAMCRQIVAIADQRQ